MQLSNSLSELLSDARVRLYLILNHKGIRTVIWMRVKGWTGVAARRGDSLQNFVPLVAEASGRNQSLTKTFSTVFAWKGSPRLN